MNFYPYSSSIILTDDIFVAYGGHTGTTTPAQREVAYLLTEDLASEKIDTFLLPTLVTGTYTRAQFAHPSKPLLLDHSHVNFISLIRFHDTEEDIFYTISGTANVHASLRNDERGIVDIHTLFGNCNCLSGGALPYKISVVYNAGLPTGTANNSARMLMALAGAADMVLNELVGFGNEAPGLVGLDQFSNQDYSEKRHGIKNTVFGSSAKAQLINKLLDGFWKRRYVGM